MNKRGFTVVELVTTVSIISVVALLLIRLTISLKELYIDSDIKTSLITKQSTLTEKIYHDLNNEVLTDITNCTEQNCNYINFVYKSGTKKFTVDSNNKTVTYDNYTYKLLSSSSFGEFSLTQTDDIVTISLPIYNKLVEGNYGLNITFNSELALDTSALVIDTSSQSTKITVTLNPGDGSVSTTKMYYEQGDTYGTLPNPRRSGYTFVGWSRLPSEYQEVQYIESNTTQYIRTDILPTNYTGIYMKYTSLNTSDDKIYIGSRNNSNGRFWIGNNSGLVYFGWNTITPQNVRPSINNSSVNIIMMNYLNNRKNSFNDSLIEAITSNLSDNPYPIIIFAGNDNGTVNYYSRIRIYSLKISEGDSIAYNFIPCYNVNTTKRGLYDKVNGTFYPNNGTGDDFSIGSNMYITSTTVVEEKNHTLYAIWQ